MGTHPAVKGNEVVQGGGASVLKAGRAVLAQVKVHLPADVTNRVGEMKSVPLLVGEARLLPSHLMGEGGWCPPCREVLSTEKTTRPGCEPRGPGRAAGMNSSPDSAVQSFSTDHLAFNVSLVRA
ncbi:hypothetical protein GCM10008957_45480 [Deinococcus ruber]|uniref:Uncharacterized protein n=1 Tax=Deinococcus ruber TaxID=1848197 RepID=A0A918CMX3_9DEIO|nr:hypothetical protein GCM10008957_45480 [Deinococcus ruber]